MKSTKFCRRNLRVPARLGPGYILGRLGGRTDESHVSGSWVGRKWTLSTSHVCVKNTYIETR